MPSVPLVPGVPPIPGNVPPVLPALLIADDASVIAFGAAPAVWGLFLTGTGQPAVASDSFVSFTLKKDMIVSDYPVEQGAFQSYDKVQLPFDARLRLAQGGSDFDRQAFLAAVDNAYNVVTQLFDVVTPDTVYPSVTVTHYDYARRADNGATLLVVDIWCAQVRQTGQQAFANTQQADGANPVSGGTAQPQPMQTSATQGSGVTVGQPTVVPGNQNVGAAALVGGAAGAGSLPGSATAPIPPSVSAGASTAPGLGTSIITGAGAAASQMNVPGVPGGLRPGPAQLGIW